MPDSEQPESARAASAQLENLRALPAEDRINAVGVDLGRQREARLYDQIDGWDLAQALGIDLQNSNDVSRAAYRASLDDFCDDHPAWDHLELIADDVSFDRYEELKREGEAITAGTRTADISLTTEERVAMEEAITHQTIDDGSGWLVLKHILTASNGKELGFEALQGCAGEIFEITGPYEIHDRGWPEHDDWVVL